MKTTWRARVGKRLQENISRRRWLKSSALLGLGTGLLGSRLLAQEEGLAKTIRSMTPMTGAELPEAWVQPAADLVKVILDDSKPLRELELGETEPSVIFTAD